MELIHEKGLKEGAFKVRDDEQIVAEMTYSCSNGNSFTIDHTEVIAAYQGLGLGKKMVAGAVEFARDNGMKIFPLCPFARKEFNQNPSYHDVSQRE